MPIYTTWKLAEPHDNYLKLMAETSSASSVSHVNSLSKQVVKFLEVVQIVECKNETV